MRLTLAALLLAVAAPLAHAQDASATLTLRVRHDARPVAGASARSGMIGAITDSAGIATLRLAAGAHDVIVARATFRAETLAVVLRAGADTTVDVALALLEPEPEGEHAEALEAVVVTSTRTGRRIEDEPTRVEVIGREEIEEKLLMTPGDISMLLNETPGLRVQAIAPSLGGATVRIQGLRGRYTQILADGLPLHGGQTGALGPLQIPPMDLAQVEVIKGAASALYGSSALGGVVNLVSRRPGETAETELLTNATTRGGTDNVLYLGLPLGEMWGLTTLAGFHSQPRADLDDDGWTDVAGYRRFVLRPRFFFTGEGGRFGMFTAGSTSETRRGGTLLGAPAPDGQPFPEELETERGDLGLIVRWPIGSAAFASARGSWSVASHVHRFGEVREQDDHRTGFVEGAMTAAVGPITAVAGAAWARDRFDSRQIDEFDYTFDVPSAFAQLELDLSRRLALSLSGRTDWHTRYGRSTNPRVSALYRVADGWTVRASAGRGTFAPTPFVEETEATGLTTLIPADLERLEAERATTASLDVTRAVGPMELVATLFGSEVENAVRVSTARTPDGQPTTYAFLYNSEHPTRAGGVELLGRWRREPFVATASYTLTRARESCDDGAERCEVPLTPEHQAGLVAAYERHGEMRAGLELYYTGSQRLDQNPYRERSPAYVVVGLLVERRFGPARVFVNAENLGDARPTRHHPLVRPVRGIGGRWTTDVWAPAEGRVLNAGVRLDLEVLLPGG